MVNHLNAVFKRFVPNCATYHEKLQKLSRTFLINVSKENDFSIILIGFVAFDGEIKDFVKLQRENSAIQQDLTSTIQEVNIRIISHVSQAIKEKSNNIVMLSNDADVVVLVLYLVFSFSNLSEKVYKNFG